MRFLTQSLIFGGLSAVILLFGAASDVDAAVVAESSAPWMASDGAGTGVYSPLTGYYFGKGGTNPFGETSFSGNLELFDLGNGRFLFQNAGRGTADETFQENIYEDGSSVSSRLQGIVQLIPELDKQGNPTGLFTADWNGLWENVKGTGRFRGATGFFLVNAINIPFNPQTDPFWSFSWSWTGAVRLQQGASVDRGCRTFRLACNGEGVFEPANLGLGDPNVIPFPIIIGDGSGEGIYDGTPIGNQFSLNGLRVGDGFDQHFGTAQSISPGVISPAGSVWYPGKSGANPDGSGRNIHIMDTRDGEIWFEYTYFFELDDVAGTIVGRADFRIVGGTNRFENARGSVYVHVVSLLSEVTGLPDEPVAPFDYDFRGFITICRNGN